MAKEGGWYNGYNPAERMEMLRVGNRLLATAKVPKASGPCSICNDPDTPVEYHSEDYTKDYIWVPPATYCLCRNCHRSKLHMRFSRPELWLAFLAHVRRGGYARDLKNPIVKREFAKYRRAIGRGEAAVLRQLRPYLKTPGTEWFASLRVDVECLHDPAARPR